MTMKISSSPKAYESAKAFLRENSFLWLITGVAGFIGSNLLETLLSLEQRVVGIDNFSTGYRKNLEEVQSSVTEEQWGRFSFQEADICDLAACRRAVADVDYVLHQAALGSVPRSINDPITTNKVNIDGFLNMLVASKDENVSQLVYAASSSTYGDHPGLPKVESIIGRPLSPYAVTKYVNEIYADVFKKTYGFNSIGLRYFNVFGARQDPYGAYAAVIPKWLSSMLSGERVSINGDGETSRDFCYVKNVVQANILAALTVSPLAQNQIYNIAVGDRTELNALYIYLRELASIDYPGLLEVPPVYRDFRAGDVRHSLADIGKAKKLLGYEPTHSIKEGLRESYAWYRAKFSDRK